MSIPTTTSHASSLSRITGLRIEAPEVEKENLARISQKYKGLITGLPKEKDSSIMYQGFWFPSTILELVMASQDVFHANPTDIYLATLPKCGTTWMKALVFSIVNRTRYSNINPTDHPLLTFNPHDVVPYIEDEAKTSKPTYMDSNSTRLFATHMPYTLLPQSVLDYGCRLVYMCRNPKDVFISTFHFINKLKDVKSFDPLPFEESFDMFTKGVSLCGPYWDHVKGYYNASVEHPTQVLFLTYENMTKDPATNVKRLADFLGYPFTAEEEAKGAVQEIVSLCSFKSLSHVNKHGKIRDGIPKEAFFREGKVGDWSNHLTKEMSQILDGITKEKFHGLNISFE